jgi:hypothetical protein
MKKCNYHRCRTLNLIELAWRGGLNAEVTASLFAQ